MKKTSLTLGLCLGMLASPVFAQDSNPQKQAMPSISPQMEMKFFDIQSPIKTAKEAAITLFRNQNQLSDKATFRMGIWPKDSSPMLPSPGFQIQGVGQQNDQVMQMVLILIPQTNGYKVFQFVWPNDPKNPEQNKAHRLWAQHTVEKALSETAFSKNIFDLSGEKQEASPPPKSITLMPRKPIREEKPWGYNMIIGFPKMLGVEGVYHANANDAFIAHIGYAGLSSLGGGYRHYNGTEPSTTYWEVNLVTDPLFTRGLNLNGQYGWETIYENGFTTRFGIGLGLAYFPPANPGSGYFPPFWAIGNMELGIGHHF